jgi:flagellar hook-length control protein FliK
MTREIAFPAAPAEIAAGVPLLQAPSGGPSFHDVLRRADAQTTREERKPPRDPHGFQTATDLAVTELSTQGPMKASVAKAAESETVAVPSPSPEKGSAAARPRPSSGTVAQGRALTSGDSPEARNHSPADHEADGAPGRDQLPAAGTSTAGRGNPQGQAAENERAKATVAAQPAQADPGSPPVSPAVASASSKGSAPAAVPSASAGRATAAVAGVKAAGPTAPTGAARQPKPAAAPDAAREKFLAQMSRGLAAALRQNGGTVTLRLKPDDLGDLKVRLQLQGGRVEARFEVATEEARSLLDKSLAALRQSLESKGLHVDRLDVHTIAKPQTSDSPGSDLPDSGPGFANHDHGAAGGEPGGNGRTGAESDRSGVGQASRLPDGQDGHPTEDAAAEPDQERNLPPAWTSRRSQGDMGGAPIIVTGLDAIA